MVAILVILESFILGNIPHVELVCPSANSLLVSRRYDQKDVEEMITYAKLDLSTASMYEKRLAIINYHVGFGLKLLGLQTPPPASNAEPSEVKMEFYLGMPF